MKKLQIIILVAFYILVCTTSAFAREKVGVFDFTGRTSMDYCILAENKLSSILLELGRFDLVARGEINTILREQRFQVSGFVNEAAVEIGRLLAVKLMFTGSIDQLSAYWIHKEQRYRAEASITVKIIDVQSGQVLHIISETGQSSNANHDRSLYLALEQCFGEKFILKLREIFSYNEAITKVDGNNIYFSNENNVRIKKGEYLRVLRIERSEEIDIRTSLKEEIGLVEVTEVVGDIVKAKIIWNSLPVFEGDRVEEVVSLGTVLSFGASVSSKYIVEKRDGPETIPITHQFPVAFNFKVGKELPFKRFGFVSFGLMNTPDVFLLNVGIEGGLEHPITPGVLYLTFSGGSGLSVAFQNYLNESASCLGCYFKIGCGGKLYFNHDKGPRLDLGIFGRYSPKMGSTWRDNNGNVVTSSRPVLNFTGFGLEAGINIPF